MHCMVDKILGGIDFNGKYSVVVIGEFDVWLNHVVMPPMVFQTCPVILRRGTAPSPGTKYGKSEQSWAA